MFSAQASQVSDSKLYVDDVFSTYLYTGNGSTQTINNGIDLAGKGGLVWTKLRNLSNSHGLSDTARGVNKRLSSDLTDSEYAFSHVSTFNSTGFDLGNNAAGNASGYTYVSWTFRKAAKFFDCGTYTGNGVAGRQIPHSLGVAPGMVIVKRTDAAGHSWATYHTSVGATKALWLDSTLAATTVSDRWNNTEPSSSDFTVGASSQVNASGATYVWYAFAHDTSAEGIIQCGSFTTDGSGNATVNLGWEPQFVMVKRTDVADNWRVVDSMRGMISGANNQSLFPNLPNAETAQSAIEPIATGFKVYWGLNATYIYLAIRRPNKPPTSGTQVYNAIGFTATGSAYSVTGAGFSPDLALGTSRSGTGYQKKWADRLRGLPTLESTQTTAEASYGYVTEWLQDGLKWDVAGNGQTAINHFFHRAPGVFDVVCYTGTGSALSVNHSLGVAPQLIVCKRRSAASITGWPVWNAFSSPLGLNISNEAGWAWSSGDFGTMSASVFTVNGGADQNSNGSTYIAYLFATKAGISKVGSYTGNGSSQTINCGFTTGARFCLIKRTDSTGDWYVWDSVRGIVAGNDPHLSLNSTAAEVTTNDSIDPDSTGFIVNQVAATNINITSATYIYLAFA